MKQNSVIHSYLYGMLKRESKGSITIHISQIHPIVKWYIRMPKKIQVETIQELVECGYLKKISRDNYELINIENKKALCDSLGEPLW